MSWLIPLRFRAHRESLARSAALIAVLLFWCSGSSVNVRAALIQIAPPPSVLQGALESKTDMYLFPEQSLILAAALPVDIAGPGLYNISNPSAPGAIPAGTHIQSYFLHKDPLGTTFTFNIGTFNVPSPQKIVGLLVTDASLDATDVLLGNPTTAYPTGLAFRSPELTFPITPDSIVWTANSITLVFVSSTAEVVDQLRILTIIPEPGTLSLALIGLASLCFAYRRQKRPAC
jgi:hypothetical protein